MGRRTIRSTNSTEWRDRATLTIPEVAEVLGIGRNSAYDAAKQGELPILKVGGRVLVPVAALERKLAEAGSDRSGVK